MESSAFHIPVSRRRLLKNMSVVSAGFTLPGYLAEAITLTPAQAQGPFYPLIDDIPLDKDNDLVKIDDHLTMASGVVTHVSGRILDRNGNPVRGALVELWHADRLGEYTYSTNPGPNPRADPNFAGFGQFLTGSSGAYRFRTLKPGIYPGRARHFHWGITLPGQQRRFSTQTYWKGEALNDSDFLLNSIGDTEQRDSIILAFSKVPGTTTLEERTTWDFVSHFTPVEPAYPGSGGLMIEGAKAAGSVEGRRRFRISVPAYRGYTYELYGNPPLANLGWKLLPFSLTQGGAIDQNQHTAAGDGVVSFYLEKKTPTGFYFVSFRVPGANKGTP
ncbi:MAG: hypothetical protein H8E20_01125 [Verrucomicrobia bacterium]|nr:hypothetical protein [Verrucomicrobiota bacterium]